MHTRKAGGWRIALFGWSWLLAAGAAAQQDVGALLDRADQLYNSGRYAEALNVCQQAAALAPRSPDVFDYRGTVRIELRQYDAAESDFQRALALGHANPARCHSQLGNIYAAQGRHEDAIAAYSRSLRLDPRTPSRYTNRGVEYRLAGQPDKAIADFKMALQLRTSDPAGVLSNLGNAYCDLERFSEALESYNRAVESDPDNFGARINRGVFFLRRGDHAAALKDLDRAVELNPDNALAYSNRGETHFALRNYPRALKDLNRAIQLDPQNVQTLATRGHVHLAQHQPEAALADFAAATRVDPKHAWAHEGAGEAYMRQKKYDKAVAHYNFVIQTEPEWAWGYGNRAEAYVKLGRLDEAMRDVTRAFQLAPNDGGLYAVRALVWAARKEFPKALEDLKKAEELIPEEAELYLDRAKIWIELGERDKALKDLRKAQHLDAGDPETKDLLATLTAPQPIPPPPAPRPVAVPQTCPACHAPLTPDMKFCPNCGARLEGAEDTGTWSGTVLNPDRLPRVSVRPPRQMTGAELERELKVLAGILAGLDDPARIKPYQARQDALTAEKTDRANKPK